MRVQLRILLSARAVLERGGDDSLKRLTTIAVAAGKRIAFQVVQARTDGGIVRIGNLLLQFFIGQAPRNRNRFWGAESAVPAGFVALTRIAGKRLASFRVIALE